MRVSVIHDAIKTNQPFIMAKYITWMGNEGDLDEVDVPDLIGSDWMYEFMIFDTVERDDKYECMLMTKQQFYEIVDGLGIPKILSKPYGSIYAFDNRLRDLRKEWDEMQNALYIQMKKSCKLFEVAYEKAKGKAEQWNNRANATKKILDSGMLGKNEITPEQKKMYDVKFRREVRMTDKWKARREDAKSAIKALEKRYGSDLEAYEKEFRQKHGIKKYRLNTNENDEEDE